jgi:hypothetical protein
MRCLDQLARAAVVLGLALLPLSALAYNLSGQRWTSPTVSMKLQLGPLSGALLDGSASWGAVAEDALASWNGNLTNVQFTVVRDSTAALGRGNGTNNVFWSSTVYGTAWDSRTLAITLSSYNTKTNAFSEADVVFNNTLNWNSYRGALRTASGGAALYDFRRVALHEFGHVLGLNHPDDIAQSVAAVMNANTSATDSLTTDDISGARAIYDSASNPPMSLLAFQGSVGFSTRGANLNLTVANINNSGNATSGSLRLELWAMPQHFSDGLPDASWNLGTYAFEKPLPAGTKYSGVDVNTTYTAPPTGTYFVVMLLTEFTGGSGSGYTIRDWLEFDTTLVTGNGVAAPVLTNQPTAQSAAAGSAVTLTVAAVGPGLTYQWFKDGVAVIGATGAALTFASVKPTDAGIYTVRIVGSGGTVTTKPAELTVTIPVNAADPGRLTNLSVLTAISAAAPNFTVAAVLGPAGTPGTRPLLVRAVGPSLSQLGVPALLADPKVDLFLGSALVDTNDNWNGAAPLRAAIAQTGAFALLSGASNDAALLAPAAVAGSYSVVVSGVAGATGNVIAEIYDGAATEFSVNRPRLVNVSVLQNLSANGALTLGFTIGGSSPLKVLVRAIGPGLSAVGLSAAVTMADPQLSLFDSASVVLKTNNDWGGDALIAAAAAQVGAFAIANTTSKDAMILMTLPPGSYTAQASGGAGSAGFAILEVYAVP